MRLFDELNIETQSTCNRGCPTCLRQSHPDKAALAARFVRRQMPSAMVYSLLDQAAALGFRGRVCLQHFNEPLQDERIGDFGRYARSLGVFSEVYANTNGDYFTAERCAALDGAFDRLHVALYSGDKAARAAQYRGRFKTTVLTFTQGEHIVTHFSPFTNLDGEIAAHQFSPCEREAQMRCIIGWDGRMMLCCEDITAQYGLGSSHETSLRDLWFGPRHSAVLALLSQPSGRLAFPYCAACPRSNTPYWGEWT